MTPDDLQKLVRVGGPKVSPDGAWVAYTVAQIDTASDKSVTHLWMVSWDGKQDVQLTYGKESAEDPQWSPDGRWLAFLASRDDSESSDSDAEKSDQVWVLDRRGGEAHPLTDVKDDLTSYKWSPDRNAMAIYSYKNKYGYELKQVVRMPNDEDGNKVFYQRRRRPNGGWTLNVQGLPPMLFNRHLLGQGEAFVVVCEGEKDATAITNFRPIETENWSAGTLPRGIETVGERAVRLAAASNHPVPDSVRKTNMLGVTSGSSKSWSPELAELLKGSRVIVLPDNDAPGAEYGKAVTDSLDAIEIGYTLVSLAETGCKDASEFIEKHGKDAFLAFVLRAWENRPRSKWLPELPGSSTMIE